MDERVTKTKVAERLLTRPAGATMREIIAATGTPQYNELKRLEARGYAVRRSKEGNETRYFATPPAASEYEATVTSKGQLTIPKDIRERLGMRAGGKLSLTVEQGNRVVMTVRPRRLADLAGMLGRPPRSLTIEEMDEAIARAVVDKYRRATR
jgi:AbrB family looped-hinge helix DNA binding protein